MHQMIKPLLNFVFTLSLGYIFGISDQIGHIGYIVFAGPVGVTAFFIILFEVYSSDNDNTEEME